MEATIESKLLALNAEIAFIKQRGVNAHSGSVDIAQYLFAYAMDNMSPARSPMTADKLGREALPRVWPLLSSYDVSLIYTQLTRLAGKHARWSVPGDAILASTTRAKSAKVGAFYVSTKKKEAEA